MAKQKKAPKYLYFFEVEGTQDDETVYSLGEASSECWDFRVRNTPEAQQLMSERQALLEKLRAVERKLLSQGTTVGSDVGF